MITEIDTTRQDSSRLLVASAEMWWPSSYTRTGYFAPRRARLQPRPHHIPPPRPPANLLYIGQRSFFCIERVVVFSSLLVTVLRCPSLLSFHPSFLPSFLPSFHLSRFSFVLSIFIPLLPCPLPTVPTPTTATVIDCTLILTYLGASVLPVPSSVQYARLCPYSVLPYPVRNTHRRNSSPSPQAQRTGERIMIFS